MERRPSETVVRVWTRLMKAQQLTLSAIERDLKQAGLPPLAWYDVLLELERAGEAGLRPFELERRMLLAQYNLSRLLDRVERDGHIERRPCEDDGRGQLVALTPSGRALRAKMWPVYAAAIEKAVGARLTPEAAQALDTLLAPLSLRPEG